MTRRKPAAWFETHADDGAPAPMVPSCMTCSEFRVMPPSLCADPAPWGWCGECDRYVCGDCPAERSACEGEGYERARDLETAVREWLGAVNA